MRTYHLWLRFCRWIGVCGDKLLRRPPAPKTEEDAFHEYTTLLEKAKAHPNHPQFHHYAGGHAMGVVVPRLPRQQPPAAS